MAKDVTTFLAWAAEPELEERHKTGVKVIIYLILLTMQVVYLQSRHQKQKVGKILENN